MPKGKTNILSAIINQNGRICLVGDKYEKENTRLLYLVLKFFNVCFCFNCLHFPISQIRGHGKYIGKNIDSFFFLLFI